MNHEAQDIEKEALPEQIEPDFHRDQLPAKPQDSIELGLRFLVGLLAIGGEQAAHRLREMQRKLDQDPSLWQSEQPSAEQSLRHQAWHFGVGLILRGQRRVRSDLRRGFERLVDTVDRASYVPEEWVGSRLPGPVREVLETQLIQWRIKTNQLIEEGKLETHKGRALATGAISEFIGEIMDELAKNPDLQEFVQDLVGQQGVSMATSAVDNIRSATVTADDAAEGLLRWLFRRTPRRELPPSPVEGMTQTMYAPKVKIEGGNLDGE